MGWDNKAQITEGCIQEIKNTFTQLIKKYNLPIEELHELRDELMVNIEEELNNLEVETHLSDYDESDLVYHLEEECSGYVVLYAPSLNEVYKIQAFKDKLKNDPYGLMIIG